MTTSKRMYDTRFFVEYFYSEDAKLVKKLKEELRSAKENLVSSLTVHEIHRINLRKEGKQVAALRSNTIRLDFKVVDVDFEIAVKSAELRSANQLPMADSVIAASALVNDCVLYSDDPHFKDVTNLKLRWCTDEL